MPETPDNCKFFPSKGDLSCLKGRKILITGAAGFVGRALVKQFLALGAHVTGFGRGADIFDANTLVWASGDFNDPMALERCCEGQDYVFHLLNSSTPDSATRQPVGDVVGNVVPSLRLIEAAAKHGVKRFIFFSSGGTVYGRVKTVPVPETAENMPLSAYGISKLSIEHYLRLLSERNGMEFRILRLSNPYGPGQSPFRHQGLVATAMHAKFSERVFDLWGDGSVMRDFIYIDDVVSACLILALDQGENQIFNVGSGIGRTVSSVLSDIDALMEKPKLVIIRHPSRQFDVPSNILEISRINGVGWQPIVSWADGLAKTKNWIRKEYNLYHNIS